jgi:hypothetical protein
MWPWSTTKRLVRRVTVGISAAYGAPTETRFSVSHHMRPRPTFQTTVPGRSDASENRVDLFAPRTASGLPDDFSSTIQDDDRGRPDDAKLPDQVQVGLRVEIHVADVVQPRGHVAQQRARRATRTAKGARELHHGRPRSEFGAELSSSQDVAAAPAPKPSVHEHQRTGDCAAARNTASGPKPSPQGSRRP